MEQTFLEISSLISIIIVVKLLENATSKPLQDFETNLLGFDDYFLFC